MSGSGFFLMLVVVLKCWVCHFIRRGQGRPLREVTYEQRPEESAPRGCPKKGNPVRGPGGGAGPAFTRTMRPARLEQRELEEVGSALRAEGGGAGSQRALGLGFHPEVGANRRL